MDACQVSLVDVFTADPLTGLPVAVLPEAGDLVREQVRAVATELGAAAAVALGPAEDADRRCVIAPTAANATPTPAAGIAAVGALADDGRIEPGSFTLAREGGTTAVAVDDDGRTWVDVEAPTTAPVDVELGAVAGALGVDVAALEDVGADLPLAEHHGGRGAVLVPVNFLQHLGSLDPDPAALADLLAAVDAETVYAYTFDAIDRTAAFHARVVDPDGPGSIGTIAPLGTVAALDHVRTQGAIDDEDGEFRIEAGHYEDRPAELYVDVAEGYRLGGRTVVALDGSIVVPEPDADEIIEV